MSLLIKGMEMPTNKFGKVLIIYPNGEVVACEDTKYEAVPVPPHGRLIDADALYKRYWTEERTLDKPYIDYLGILATESPTIIGEER